MFRKLAIGLMLVGLVGCASMSLPDDATTEQIQAAKCLDARTGLAMADAALCGVTDPEVQKYWQAFRTGCVIAISTYCSVTVM